MEYVGEDHAVFPITMKRLKTKVLHMHNRYTLTCCLLTAVVGPCAAYLLVSFGIDALTICGLEEKQPVCYCRSSIGV